MQQHAATRAAYRPFKAWAFLCLCMGLLAAPSLILAQEAVAPTDVYMAVKKLSGDIERLRVHMGAPAAKRLQISVENAAPHDVYFQARNLYLKLDQLAFEHLRLLEEPPPLAEGVKQPADVLAVVRRSDHLAQQLLNEYGLPSAEAREALSAIDRTPSEVFGEIQALGRQLNLMLDRPQGPSETLMALTQAVGYAANLLGAFPRQAKIPVEPPLAPGKTPADVFEAMLGCLDRLATIYHHLGFSSVQLSADVSDPLELLPSDAADLAALIVARLDYLQEQLPNIEEPLPPVYPGRAFPSHVYRRVGLLRTQLDDLVSLYSVEGIPAK